MPRAPPQLIGANTYLRVTAGQGQAYWPILSDGLYKVDGASEILRQQFYRENAFAD